MQERTRQGRCLCGSVRFETTGQPVIVAHCHCKDCQRLTGAGHSTGAMFSDDQISLTGKLGTYELVSDNKNTVTRSFCPACGSPVHGQNTASDGYKTISLGLFDDPSDFDPEVVVFARNRNGWDVMDADIVTFDAQPEWTPEGS